MPIIEIQTKRAKLLYMSIDDKHLWYDNHPDLEKAIDKLEDLNRQDRDEIIRGLRDIILNHDDELFDRHAVEFPMTCARSWYDKDPYAWLVINSLKYVDEDLITDIFIYLKEKL
jgi:hypothetical protein